MTTCARGLVHEPVRPCRDGSAGEVVFLSRWQMLMLERSAYLDDDEDGCPLSGILAHVPGRVQQRDATLAASFMTWLGTRVGQCFILDARMIAASRPLGVPFLAAWSAENLRRRHVNGGVRAIEWLLVAPGTPVDPISGAPVSMPAISVRDLEVTDQLAVWLGQPAGRAYLAACEGEMDAVGAYELRLWREANERGGPHQVGLTVHQTLDFLEKHRNRRAAA